MTEINKPVNPGNAKTIRGITAEGVRFFATDNEQYPFALLLENITHRQAMSAAVTLEQAESIAKQILEAVDKKKKAGMI